MSRETCFIDNWEPFHFNQILKMRINKYNQSVQKKCFYKILNASISSDEFARCQEEGLFLKDVELDTLKDPYPNQFIELEKQGEQKKIYVRYVAEDKPLKFVKGVENIFGIKAKNLEQQFALDVLLDPEIDLITLTGTSGCGKTLLSIASALHQLESKYIKLIVSKPLISLGKEIGFIPGTIEEKMAPWLNPIKDQFELLLNKKPGRRQKNGVQIFEDYLREGSVEIEVLTYIRGRSINNSFLFFTECQNMNLSELKCILTRVGKGTKIVLDGDIEQSDIKDSGLGEVIEKFKPHKIAAHVDLISGERSELATLASEIL